MAPAASYADRAVAQQRTSCLTRCDTGTNIAAMQRETLLAILERATGLSKDGERYTVREGHQLTVFIGQPGRSVAIEHVLGLLASATHLEVEARDRGTFYLGYDALHALLDAPRKDRKGGPAGGVGF